MSAGADMDIVLVLGAFAGMLAGFWALLKSVNKQAAEDRQAERLERQELTQALNRVAKSNHEVALATKQGAREAKERNGHLGEQSEKIVQLVLESQKNVIDAVQHVHTQNVEHQHVGNTEEVG